MKERDREVSTSLLGRALRFEAQADFVNALLDIYAAFRLDEISGGTLQGEIRSAWNSIYASYSKAKIDKIASAQSEPSQIRTLNALLSRVEERRKSR